MPQPGHQRNASYWLRVKQDEARLAHYRARRARNQRARRSGKASTRTPSPDTDLLAMLVEHLSMSESQR
jgi:hypothetical protein